MLNHYQWDAQENISKKLLLNIQLFTFIGKYGMQKNGHFVKASSF